jgi:hypothetical protein
MKHSQQRKNYFTIVTTTLVDSCNTPLIPHNGCYQIPFPLNLCNTRKEIEKESIAKSGSTSLERSITRGNIEFIHDIKER